MKPSIRLVLVCSILSALVGLAPVTRQADAAPSASSCELRFTVCLAAVALKKCDSGNALCALEKHLATKRCRESRNICILAQAVGAAGQR